MNQSESSDGTPLLAPKQLHTPSTISQRAPVLIVHGAGGSLLGRRVKSNTLASGIAFVYLDCGTFGKETSVTKAGGVAIFAEYYLMFSTSDDDYSCFSRMC